MLRDLICLSETAAAADWRQWILPSVSSMGSSSWVVQTSLHHAVAEDDPKIWTYPKQPDVNKGEVFSVDSPSDVKAGTFVGYQVPQELSVLSHSLLHIHFLLLRHTHLCHDEPPRIYRRQTQTRRHSAVLTQLTLSWKMSFFHLISRAGVCKTFFLRLETFKGPHTRNWHHRICCNECSWLCRLTSAASHPKSCSWTHHNDYSRRPTSSNILHLCERKYLLIPPGGGSLDLSFKTGNRRL